MDDLQEQLNWYGRLMCMPLALLINFSLFQYLLGTYYKRRKEKYVRLILFCGLCSFIVIIPLSHPDDVVVARLNDVSEILSVLTFLIQIVMIGKNITRKINIRSLKYLTLFAELLTYLGIALSIKTVIELFVGIDLGYYENADNVMEDISVWFIFCFRFYYMSLSRGLVATLKARKREVILYFLFATHEYPFIVLEATTHVSWEEVQALWHRMTLAMCLMHTLHEKIKSSRSSHRARTQATISQASSARASIRHTSRVPTAALINRVTAEINRRRSSINPLNPTKTMVIPIPRK